MEEFFHQLLIAKFSDREVFFAGVVFFLFLQELVVRLALARLKSEHRTKSEKLSEPREIEEVSLEYNGNRQRITLFRVIGYVLAVLAISIYLDYRAGASIALVAGAIVVALKETIVSGFTYFYILAHYRIGDDIRVGENYGEIIAIEPTRTTLLSKDSEGEFTARVVEIQNYHFAILPVTKQETKVDTHRLVHLDIPIIDYPETLDFTIFTTQLKEHLDTLLPQRTIRNVGHFRSYAGVRYKLDYEYNRDKGHLLIRLAFISHPKNVGARKEEIISFVEAIRTSKVLTEAKKPTDSRPERKKTT